MAFSRYIELSPNEDLEEISRNLFAAIREVDQANLDLILIDSCDKTGLGTAIMDRLTRACSDFKIDNDA